MINMMAGQEAAIVVEGFEKPTSSAPTKRRESAVTDRRYKAGLTE